MMDYEQLFAMNLHQKLRESQRKSILWGYTKQHISSRNQE